MIRRIIAGLRKWYDKRMSRKEVIKHNKWVKHMEKCRKKYIIH
jgi:hypothetical protein